MRYNDFIAQTLSGENDIIWDYYGQGNNQCWNKCDLLNPQTSSRFIKEYFKSGAKELPIILDGRDANNFINQYFSVAQKEFALSLNIYNDITLPDTRATHTVSGYFLGLLVEKCLMGENSLSIHTRQCHFPFTYLWFLTYLYHDYGYCVAEREDNKSPITIPPRAPIPVQTLGNRIQLGEYRTLSAVRRKLGICLSPYSTYHSFSYIMRSPQRRPEILSAILTELTQRSCRISGGSNLSFSTESWISNCRYSSSITTRYFNYCINELSHADHGIVGGYLFYDRMIKNYAMCYLSELERSNTILDLSNFHYRDRHFCFEQLSIFSYITDCIMTHNIWKANESNQNEAYERYSLYELIAENYKIITFQNNPLLYILAIADTLEPTKIYKALPISHDDICSAIEVNYRPGEHEITFFSNSLKVDIGELYKKAKGLEAWTSVRCSNLNDGKFTITI